MIEYFGEKTEMICRKIKFSFSWHHAFLCAISVFIVKKNNLLVFIEGKEEKEVEGKGKREGDGRRSR